MDNSVNELNKNDSSLAGETMISQNPSGEQPKTEISKVEISDPFFNTPLESDKIAANIQAENVNHIVNESSASKNIPVVEITNPFLQNSRNSSDSNQEVVWFQQHSEISEL